MREPRRTFEGTQGALQSSFPPVRGGDAVGDLAVVGREGRGCAQPLTLGGRTLERPGQLGQWAATRPPSHVVFREQPADFVPERARLPRCPLVTRRLADEVQPSGRPCARRVKEVAITCDGVARRDPCVPPVVELAAEIVGEKRRLVPAARERPAFEPEHEDDVGPTRART